MKHCFKCGETKQFSDFYAHPKTADGLFGKCKECQKAAVNANRKANHERYVQYDRDRATLPHRKALNARVSPEWRRNNPTRYLAQNAVNNAVRDGRLKRQPCWVCGEKAVAHHPDYSAPLDVVWLCQVHHKQAHALVT